MSILLLGGSPSLPSRSSRLLLHIGDKLALQGHRCSRLQVRDLPAEALLHADFGDAAIVGARALVAAADAIVIATPVYQASYTGILKAFLDLLAQDGLAGKLVLPVATGGSQSHVMALDYALRPVLAALSAGHVLASIYATSNQLHWDTESGLTPDALTVARVNAGVDELSAALLALQQRRTPSAGRPADSPPSVRPSSARSLKDYPYNKNTQNSHPASSIEETRA